MPLSSARVNSVPAGNRPVISKVSTSHGRRLRQMAGMSMSLVKPLRMTVSRVRVWLASARPSASASVAASRACSSKPA